MTAIAGQLFPIVRDIVCASLKDHLNLEKSSKTELASKLKAHLEQMSREHNKVDAEIPYTDPLCRIGYLYKHAAANAFLVRQALRESQAIYNLFKSQAKTGSLTVTVGGGGPGTEFLGLMSFFQEAPSLAPSKLEFKLLDKVNHWADTWNQLRAKCWEPPLKLSTSTVTADFLALDVMEPSAYTNLPSLLRQTNLVIFNYLFSENQSKLKLLPETLKTMSARVSKDCLFLAIDRAEQRTTFNQNVASAFPAAGLELLEHRKIAGSMDESEGPLTGAMLSFDGCDTSLYELFGQRPRRWFQTYTEKFPTVSTLLVRKK